MCINLGVGNFTDITFSTTGNFTLKNQIPVNKNQTKLQPIQMMTLWSTLYYHKFINSDLTEDVIIDIFTKLSFWNTNLIFEASR